MTAKTETFEFQTEARQLLDLMIHSVYSKKDIFLRELISNSSDALDKRRFDSLTNPDLLEAGTDLQIVLETDSDARTLTVRDNGIGMTRDDVIELIGTIARSGTREFLEKLRESREKGDGDIAPELIGQFGVGFYSSFMAADRVILETRKAGEATASRWESSGDGTYSITETERDEPGTTVTLHLKPVDSDDAVNDYTESWTLRQIVKKYSDFVSYPIRMEVERTEAQTDADGNPIEGAEPTVHKEIETLNSMKAIWTRNASEVTDEEYNEFYKHISHDWTEPLLRISAKIEGTLEYRALLFIPSAPPMDLFQRDSHRGVQLYVKRVFILDDCKALIPEYLRFIRGVVDSEDLSLNISRELLQEDRQIQRMRKGLVKKLLGALEELRDEDEGEEKDSSDDEGKYLKFWNLFGSVLKEGLYGDLENRDTLLDLLLCESTQDSEKLTSLDDYVSRMSDDQELIYYLCGESREVIENSPHLEALLDRGHEVLILTDPVDAFWTDQIPEYKGKKLQSASKGSLDGDENEKKDEDRDKEFDDVLEFLKDRLDDHVKEVRLSNRLTSSAACLVGDAGDLSPQMEQLLRATQQALPPVKRILEVNPEHALIQSMQRVFEADRSSADLTDMADLLYGQALIAEGGRPPNPGRFSKLVADWMVKATQ